MQFYFLFILWTWAIYIEWHVFIQIFCLSLCSVSFLQYSISFITLAYYLSTYPLSFILSLFSSSLYLISHLPPSRWRLEEALLHLIDLHTTDFPLLPVKTSCGTPPVSNRGFKQEKSIRSALSCTVLRMYERIVQINCRAISPLIVFTTAGKIFVLPLKTVAQTRRCRSFQQHLSILPYSKVSSLSIR